MKALLLVTLVAFSAVAADAPLAETTVVNEGQTLSVTGPAIVLPADSAIHLARRLTMDEAERDALKEEVAKSTPSWVVPLVAICAFVAGGALGVSVGIAYANSAPK